MEKESNVVDLDRFRFTKPFNVLIARASNCASMDVSFLYDIYHIDPDILVCISLDPFCDEAYHSLYARYGNKYIVETSRDGITTIFSHYRISPRLVMIHPDHPTVEVHNIVVGPDTGGLNLVFACGEMLSGLNSLVGLWDSVIASNGYLFLDHSYMIARNLEIMQSDIPSDLQCKDMKLVHYNFRIKEPSNE